MTYIDINDKLKSIYSIIISSIQKSLGKSSGWIIDSVIQVILLIFQNKINLKDQKTFDHPRLIFDYYLIDIQNIDENGCLKQCLVRYLHPVDYQSAKVRKLDKDFAKKNIKI